MSPHPLRRVMSGQGVFACMLLLGMPFMTQAAQTAPDSSASTLSMDMSAMPGMDMSHGHMSMPASPASTSASPQAAPVTPASTPSSTTGSTPPAQHSSSMDMHAMPGMDMSHDHSSVHTPASSAQHDMDHSAMGGMSMGPMQGGKPPADARSPDYSDGIAMTPMTDMDMHDHEAQSMLLIDQLEGFHGRDANGQTWEAEGWYGTDTNKAWFRTEGDRSAGRVEDADLEAFWAHAVATYWDTQLGVRQDLGSGPHRTWAAFGIQGLAPYWFELEATGYISNAGRTAARLRAEYELLFTQRLILQPEFEANLYGKSDPQGRIGDGLSDMQLGLRLRYEFTRQFAPYIGVVWVRRFGTTADYLRHDREPVFDQQIVAGVRFWF